MGDDQYPKKIDLLDTALTVYRQVDAPAGLEARILGTIEEKLRRRRFRVRFLMAATAAAASIGLALFVLVPARVPLHEPVREPAIVALPAPSSAAPAKSEVKIPRAVSRVQEAAAPRQSTFPAPSPLSEQERALISLMQSRRQILVAMSQSRPLDIRGNIDISPIEVDRVISGGDAGRPVIGK